MQAIFVATLTSSITRALIELARLNDEERGHVVIPIRASLTRSSSSVSFEFDHRPRMTITAAEVVRHFLRLEARRSKFADRKDELLSWCELSDPEVMVNTRCFAEERDDVNPVLVYTVGAGGDDRSSRITSWTRERIKCRDIFTSGISCRMRPDIDALRGNMRAFALGPAKAYSEFRPLSPLCDISSIIILVAHRRQDRDGHYEAIDGAHRIVALCRAGSEEVDAYVGHMQ